MGPVAHEDIQTLCERILTVHLAIAQVATVVRHVADETQRLCGRILTVHGAIGQVASAASHTAGSTPWLAVTPPVVG